MCDRCGTIFSERADDWSTYTGSRRRRDKTTGQVTVSADTLDACPECTAMQFDAPAERPALPTTTSPHYEPEVSTHD